MEMSSLINLIYINRPTSFPTVCVVATSLSHDELISCTRKIKTEKYHPLTIKCKKYVNYAQTNLINNAQVINSELVYSSTNVNFAVNYLSEKLKHLFDTHALLIQKRVKGKPCEWSFESVKRDMNRRDHLLGRARKNNDKHSWGEYKKLRNKCTNKVRKAKATYCQRSLNDNRLNHRKFWNSIKRIFPVRSKKPNFGNVSRERVNCFVDYFSNIVNEMKSVAFPITNFVWRFSDKKPLRTEKIVRFSYMSTAFVERELRHLNRNKVTGTDSLPPNLLKDCSSFLATPLAHILNLSLNTIIVPSIWKLAKISPTCKSGNSEHVDNYRPISVLPVLSKMLEKAVRQ